MLGAIANWVVILFVGFVHLAMYGILLGIIGQPDSTEEFAFYLTMPFADVGVLGFWLVVGSHRAWLRLMVTIVGFCAVLAIGVNAMEIHPMILAPAYAATLSSTALGTLGLGCIAAYFPGWRGWQVRFALWEIIVATCLIGIALAVLRGVMVNDLLNWNQWLSEEGREFLTFSIVSGIFLAIAGLPILATGWNVRGLAMIVMFVLLSVMPAIEREVFAFVGSGRPSYGLLYYAHIFQVACAWLTLVPLRWAFPGLLQAWSQPVEPIIDAASQESNEAPTQIKSNEDFFEMQ